MDILHARCASLDVHKESVTACVLLPGEASEPIKHQEGSSPSSARMRSSVSKSGDNTSLAEESKVWRSLNGHKGESRTQPRRTWSHRSQFSGGRLDQPTQIPIFTPFRESAAQVASRRYP